ncbi:uncharacterized protein [Antedon mediterranea]|uniref:uncharacterized protein n=1 Tax=Antedon mediterranea TaxID=105859 RepID=UPI003AF9E2A2
MLLNRIHGLRHGLTLKPRICKRFTATLVTDADYADDLALLSNTIAGETTLIHALKKAASSIGLYRNVKKTESMSVNCQGQIKTSSGYALKQVDQLFTYLGSNIASTTKDVDIRISKAWSALKRLTVVWKSNISNNMKKHFFKTTVETVLLYGSSTWTLTKKLENTLNGTENTRMLRAVLNVSWQEHLSNAQLYGNRRKITDVIKERRVRFVGHSATKVN